MVYCRHIIYSSETKQNKAVGYLNVVSQNTITIYIQMVSYTVITYSVHDGYCFALSPRRPYEEYKRMVLEHTHGLFIT
jgi:hypothetical protein